MKKKSIILLSLIVVMFLSVGIAQGDNNIKYGDVKLKLSDTSVLKLKIQENVYDIPKSSNLDVPVIKLDVDSQMTQIPFELNYTDIQIEFKDPEYSFTKPDGIELKPENDEYVKGLISDSIGDKNDVNKKMAEGNKSYMDVPFYENNLKIGEGYTVALSVNHTQKIKANNPTQQDTLKVEYSLYTDDAKFAFKIIAPLDIKIVQSENGTISSNITDDKFYEGDNIVLEAQPKEGYVFKGWRTTGDISIDGNETGILNANQKGTITAEFEAITPQEPEIDNQEPEVDNKEPEKGDQKPEVDKEPEKNNQVIEEDNTKKDRVQTGDTTDLQVLFGCLLVTGVVGFTLYRKKNI